MAEDPETTRRELVEALGLTFPMLADLSSEVWSQYNETGWFEIDAIVDSDGVVRYKQH